MKAKSNNKGIDPERLNNIGAESDEIINNLKNDPKYCQRFFYGSKKEKCIIDSMRSKMLYDLLKDYLKDEEEDLYWSQGALEMIEKIGAQNWLIMQL